ncbi:MAG: hypothetical protein DRJ62_04990 [Thermoprotei archaeon]|nr:MAG: hypothetical protein DRJ62_04990 [Thermoprotei archaeon]
MSFNLKPKLKMWFEVDGKPVLGQGGVELLKAIEEKGSISAAASSLGLSYRFAWNYIVKAERALGAPLVVRSIGGSSGGGSKLTSLAKELIAEYERIKALVDSVSSMSIKVSVNSLRCIVEDLAVDGGYARLKLRVKAPYRLRVAVTKESLMELGVKEGSTVNLMFKAADVALVSKEPH